MNPIDVRAQLIDALNLDLVGPTGDRGDRDERLSQAPSRWYLTGLLVPNEANETQKLDPTSIEELDQAAEPVGVDDSSSADSVASKKTFLPSSMGMSLLLPAGSSQLTAVVRYGDYTRSEAAVGATGPKVTGPKVQWKRLPRTETVDLELGTDTPGAGRMDVPGSRGVQIVWSVRGVPETGIVGGLPKGSRSVSLFLVNNRVPSPDDVRDEGFIFQAELEVSSEQAFIPRPNLRSLESDDWDERVADLQYRDACEYSVGHGVSTKAFVDHGLCKKVRTCWLPDAEVERVAPTKIEGVELEME
ncbi:MAG: helicase, partial [Planctomycetaceae bacterium]|nr:helicase [Planctomycetaceae bacterium]